MGRIIDEGDHIAMNWAAELIGNPYPNKKIGKSIGKAYSTEISIPFK